VIPPPIYGEFAKQPHGEPLAGTELCEAPHFQTHLQGTLQIVMADGTVFTARPGHVTATTRALISAFEAVARLRAQSSLGGLAQSQPMYTLPND
jgi:hypothetical protein